jgi:plasmid stabilization system protein ParE
MMQVRWSIGALADLDRLHDFLSPKDAKAAARTVQAIRQAAAQLSSLPRLGERNERFSFREVRRIQYEVKTDRLLILRVWHTKERRQ